MRVYCAAYNCHNWVAVEDGKTGRPKSYCSNACRQRDFRMRCRKKRYESLAREDGGDSLSGMNHDQETRMEIPGVRAAAPVQIPWERVRRASTGGTRNPRGAALLRSQLLRVLESRGRLLRSGLANDAADLIRQLDDKARTLRAQMKGQR